MRDKLREAFNDHEELLASVAEMYYIKGKSQAEIAERIHLSRSMVSHLLNQARQLGIIEFKINWPLPLDRELAAKLVEQFNLREASVVVAQNEDYRSLVKNLGVAAARLVRRYLTPGMVLGISWGTAMSATVQAFEPPVPMPVKVVQMVGALGAREQEYDGNMVVQRLARALMGEAFYLNAPFVVDSVRTAQSLRVHQAIQETLDLARHSDVALFGVGTTAPAEYSSFYRSGYVKPEELEHLRATGAVGDVCGYHFDVNGNMCEPALSERTIAIGRDDLLAVPIRVAVAGGIHKIPALRGALRAGYINVLVTDKQAAEGIL